MAVPGLEERLDALLPQTFCRQCGFDGCRAYARAMAEGRALPNRCAPGGDAGAAALAQVLGVPGLPLDPEYGREMPFAVARIRPAECIGCARCRKACPVDAVTGGPKRLHAVIEAACSGCALCVDACPVGAIEMKEAGREWTRDDAIRSHSRHEARARRIERERREEEALYETLGSGSALERRKAAVDAILALAAKLGKKP